MHLKMLMYPNPQSQNHNRSFVLKQATDPTRWLSVRHDGSFPSCLYLFLFPTGPTKSYLFCAPRLKPINWNSLDEPPRLFFYWCLFILTPLEAPACDALLVNFLEREGPEALNSRACRDNVRTLAVVSLPTWCVCRRPNSCRLASSTCSPCWELISLITRSCLRLTPVVGS